MNTREFIKQEWKKCIYEYKTETEEGFFALPYQFVPPSAIDDGMFPLICYWDTFFTNIGLVIDGYLENAIKNTDNIKFLIDKIGYMPNAAGKAFENRSQFPVYAQMVWEVYNITKNTAWLESSLNTIEKEYYDFWMKKRITKCGLNGYDTSATDEECDMFFDYVATRIDVSDIGAAEKTAYGRHFFAEAESGWDFNPRFKKRCRNFAPVDLNSQLYIYENILKNIYDLFGMETKSNSMVVAMNKRKELMEKYCKSKNNGLFYDYDFERNQLTDIESCASFLPYYAGISDDSSGAKKLLEILECENGISCCKNVGENFQWGYPNMWANLMYFSYKALKNCGLDNDAVRIAKKYMNTVEKSYEKTGKVWEKYDAVKGLPTENNEYGISVLMGWSAGIYCYFAEEIF